MLSIASAAFAFQGYDLVTKFNEWKLAHAKTYASSDAEASALAAYASNNRAPKNARRAGETQSA